MQYSATHMLLATPITHSARDRSIQSHLRILAWEEKWVELPLLRLLRRFSGTRMKQASTNNAFKEAGQPGQSYNTEGNAFQL